MSLTDPGMVPVLFVLAPMAASLLFPALRRRIRLRRAFIFGLDATAVLFGMFYWTVSLPDPDYAGMPTDICLWATWPLEDLTPNGNPTLIYWLPWLILKGLFFGFTMESLLVLGKQARADVAASTRHLDEPPEANQPPFGAAGAACLACMLVIYLAIMPLLALCHSPLMGWLLVTLDTIGPLSSAFVVLYFSDWYREGTTIRRLFSVACRSCAVFGVTSLLVALLIPGLFLAFSLCGPYSRGQYGAALG